MRINHNITAMNSYRNFSANTSKLSKNLEKVSTGMRINRAGDDAAGLAISEKMRAQMSGIEGATKNAKDGISLIQTAEGALTEVHDMLNRMTTLAEQSANGTYDDSVDRNQLQKEVDALKTEIDRIADSTNYNGIKLLDGSLSGAGGLKGNVNTNDTAAVAGSATTNAFSSIDASADSLTEGDKLTYSMTWEEDGKERQASVSFTVSTDKLGLIAEDGTEYRLSDTGKATGAELSIAVLGEIQKNAEVTKSFDVSRVKNDGTVDTSTDTNNTSLKFAAKAKGTKGAVLTNTDTKMVDKETGEITSFGADQKKVTYAKDSMQKIDFKNLKVLTATNIATSGDAGKAVEDNTFEIDSKKFVFIGANEDYDKMKSLVGSDVNMIQMKVQAGNDSITADGAKFAMNTAANVNDYTKIAAELSRVTGRSFSVQTAAPGDVESKAGIKQYDILLKGDTKLSKSGKSLDLQIGDTADSFNKLSVSVEDMHAKSIGIGDVDISTQEGAAKALDQIKASVNYVSNTRGSLGALQNRLDHTINNLGVMKENITSAESLIRDTDVAEEMMTYTKNNILNQSAQAMLAQANQLPQGVLQLLG